MTILAIDTASRSMGLALYQADRVLYESSWHSDNYHTVELAPAIKGAFAQAGISRKKISAIALAIGPGSYTGLRIGLALAKGMAFPLGIPIVPVPTLDILAAGHPVEDLPLIALIQAGRGRLSAANYTAQDGKWQQEQAPYLISIDDLYESTNHPTIICGELLVPERKKLARKKKSILLASSALSVRRPALLAELAHELLEMNQEFPMLALAPEYLQSDSLPAS